MDKLEPRELANVDAKEIAALLLNFKMEAFFVSQLSHGHQVHYHDRGDFIVDDQFIFEIGGAGKSGRQPDRQSDACLVADDIETGAPNRIPLWLFGMGY